MTQRIAVFPADRHSLYEKHGYSAAIRSGDLLFVSGQFRNKGYCPNPLMLILGKTGSIICTGFILFIPALHPV